MIIPIPTTHLFPVLDQQLIELLQSLSKDDWYKPTIAKKWQVKDIAAHLLDGNIRTPFAAESHGLACVPAVDSALFIGFVKSTSSSSKKLVTG